MKLQLKCFFYTQVELGNNLHSIFIFKALMGKPVKILEKLLEISFRFSVLQTIHADLIIVGHAFLIPIN